MTKLSRGAQVTCLALVLGLGLFVAACNDAPSPTAPPPPTENVAAAPGSASLATGESEGVPEAGADPSVAGAPVPVQEAARGGQQKVDVCHQKGNGSYHIINVAESAVAAHEGHGDWLVAEEVCDLVDNDCDGEVDEDGICDAFTCPCADVDEYAYQCVYFQFCESPISCEDVPSVLACGDDPDDDETRFIFAELTPQGTGVCGARDTTSPCPGSVAFGEGVRIEGLTVEEVAACQLLIQERAGEVCG